MKGSIKFEIFSEIRFNKKKRDNFSFMKVSIKQPLNPLILQTRYFRRKVCIFQTTFVKIVNQTFFFDFWSYDSK